MVLAFADSVRVAATTSGTPGVTTQDVTIAGVTAVPKAARITLTSALTDSTLADHLRVSIGVTDGTYQGGFAKSSQDATASAVAKKIGFDGGIIILPSADGSTVVAVAEVDSLIPGGIRLLWTGPAMPDAAYLIEAEFYFGDNLQAQAGDARPPSPASGSLYVGTGFRPQDVHFLCAATTALDETFANNGNLQIARSIVGTGVSPTITTFLAAWREIDGAASGEGAHLTASDGTVGITYANSSTPFSTTNATSIVDADDGGFFLRSTIGINRGPRVVYLALNWGAGRRLSATFERTPTSTGSQSYRPGWKAVAAWTIQSAHIAATWAQENAGAVASVQATGFMGPSRQAVATWLQEDAAATMQTGSAVVAAALHLLLPQTGSFGGILVAGVGSFHATDGIAINYVVVSAFQHGFVLILLEEGTILDPDPAELAFAVPDPAVLVTATPAAVALPLVVPDPARLVTLTPAPVELTLVVPDPAILITATPAPVELELVAPDPAVLVTATPAPVAAAFVVPDPTLEQVVATPAAVALPLVVPDPAVLVTATPATVALPLVVPDPAILAAEAPAPVALAFVVPDPTILGNLQPSPVELELVVPDLAVLVTVTPAAVALALVVPDPALEQVVATPAAVALPLVVPDPAVLATETPDPVEIALAVPDPAILVTATPAPVALAFVVPDHALVQVVAEPDPVALALVVPDPAVLAAETPDPVALAFVVPDPARLVTLTPAPVELGLVVPDPALGFSLMVEPVELALVLPDPAILVTLTPGAVELALVVPAPLLSQVLLLELVVALEREVLLRPALRTALERSVALSQGLELEAELEEALGLTARLERAVEPAGSLL